MSTFAGLVTAFLVTLAAALSHATPGELRGPFLVGAVASGALVIVPIALELRRPRPAGRGRRALRSSAAQPFRRVPPQPLTTVPPFGCSTCPLM